MKLKNLFYLCFLVLEGCLIVDTDYHKTFIEQNSIWVGGTVQSLHRFHSDKPLSEEILPNGNVQKQWIWKLDKNKKNVTCSVFYEYNLKINLVLRWWFEGRKEDCIGVP
jgi:hypothetical protein